MKKLFLCVVSTFMMPVLCSAQIISDGEKTFKATCSACHSIGKGKIVGPDLSGVNSRRTSKWLLSFIKSPQTVMKNGDPIAIKLFNDHNKIQMPDQNLSEVQIKNVLAFIKSKSPIPSGSSIAKTATKLKSANNLSHPKPSSEKKLSDSTDFWIDAEFKIKSIPATSDINPTDFNSHDWTNAVSLKLSVTRPNITYPNLKEASLDTLFVKSVYRPNQVAFLVEWKDSTKNVEVDVDKFCDQLAVEFPLNSKEIPSYMMGNKDGMVHIVHWKAIWQEDNERGYRDVQVMYPNMWVDVYPGLESYLDRSKQVYAQDITAEQIIDTRSYGNMPGTYSHNPMSQIKRKEPVEEANAEGFGTIATQETQQARGWGEWKNGRWKICIVVPVNTGNIYKATIKEKTKVAFALWDGGFQNIGGRKHFIPWVDIYFEK